MQPLPPLLPPETGRVLVEDGDYDGGDGLRMVVLAHDLLLTLRYQGEQEDYRIPLLMILEAMMQMQAEVES